MAGYIGTQAVSVNTTSATISDDLSVGDDALITGTLTTTAAAVFNGGFTSNADTNTFTSANASDPLVIIKNTANDASGARLSFQKDKGANAADGDDIGTITFIGDNNAQEQTNFGSIVVEVSESQDTDEAGKMSFFVAESNGTASQLTAGLIIEGEHGTDGEVDVTIGAATTSLTTIAGDMTLKHDEAVLGFGADTDVSITHVHNTGLLLGGTRFLQFNDASQSIGAPDNVTLDLNATNEIELNATLIDVNGNLDVSGYNLPEYTRAKYANGQTGNNGDNYWKLGRLVIKGPKTARLNLFGKSGYGDGGTNEGETILLMRGSVSVDQMEGRFITHGAVGPGVKGMGYVPVSGADDTFDIYGHLASYMSLEHEVITGGSWETSIADTGSTSAPTGYVAFTADNEVYLGVTRSHGYSTTAFVHNEDAANMDFRVESAGNDHMMFVDASANYVMFGKSSATAGPTGFMVGQGNAGVYSTINGGNTYHVYNGNYKFYVASNGGIYNFQANNSNLSDQREKKNIVSTDAKWGAVKAWSVKEFHYNADEDSDAKKLGVIAQDVETNHPELITEFKTTEDATRKAVKEQQMMWMAIKALQEAQARIETLEAKVTALENA